MKLSYLLPSWMKSEAENVMKAEIGGLGTVICLLVAMRNLLGASGLVCSGMDVGATAQVKFKVLPFRGKIQGLALIGCVWQWPC